MEISRIFPPDPVGCSVVFFIQGMKSRLLLFLPPSLLPFRPGIILDLIIPRKMRRERASPGVNGAQRSINPEENYGAQRLGKPGASRFSASAPRPEPNAGVFLLFYGI